MPGLVYKVLPEPAWLEACRRGHFEGSLDDVRDGFIHLSTAHQLPGTLLRHFCNAAGRPESGLVLITLDPARLGPSLRWEPARDGSLFPHLYGPLDPRLATHVRSLVIAPDGHHDLTGIADHA